MFRSLESNQRIVQPLRPPVGLPVAPPSGVAGYAVFEFVAADILSALVVITAGGARRPDKREPDGVVIRLVRSVLAVGENRSAKLTAHVCQINPLVRGHFKFSRLCG